MKITMNNYETFLMDYLDGKLSATEEQEVLVFLERYPHIKEEFEGIAAVTFSDDNTSFDTSSLLKPQYAEVKHTYEPLLVAQLEGDLSLADEYILQQGFTLYPELHNDRKLFALAHYAPDLSIVFPYKHQLKKGNLLVLHRQPLLRVAAVLLFAGILGFLKIQFDKTTPSLVGDYNVRQVSPEHHLDQPKPAASIKTPLHQQPTSTVENKEVKSAIQYNKPLAIMEIDHKETLFPKQAISLETITLTDTKTWLNYPKAVTPAIADDYVPLQAFLKNKTKTTLQKAGVTIQTDSTDRITSIEIVALGFEWSQTR